MQIRGWQIRRIARHATIAGTTFALIYYGLDQAKGTLAAWLVLIGAIALGWAWSKAWIEPSRE